jgi:hypothetical protein
MSLNTHKDYISGFRLSDPNMLTMPTCMMHAMHVPWNIQYIYMIDGLKKNQGLCMCICQFGAPEKQQFSP